MVGVDAHRVHAKTAPTPYTLVAPHDDLRVDRVPHSLRPALVQRKVTAPTAVGTPLRHVILVRTYLWQADSQAHSSLLPPHPSIPASLPPFHHPCYSHK